MAKAELKLTRQDIFDAVFEYVRKYYGIKGEINASIKVEYNSIREAKITYDMQKVQSREENPFMPK